MRRTEQPPADDREPSAPSAQDSDLVPDDLDHDDGDRRDTGETEAAPGGGA